MTTSNSITDHSTLIIQQRFELGEFVGFETRNKYAIETESGELVGFAAEQQRGILALLMRGFLGHWRRFDIYIFDNQRNKIATLHHPFRWFFQRLEVTSAAGHFLGAIQQRFAILSKSFDVEDNRGTVLMTVRSPIWRIWTFVFNRGDHEVGRIEKKWSGLFSEAFSDRDKFKVTFSPTYTQAEVRLLQLAAGLFVDLQYFERKAGHN